MQILSKICSVYREIATSCPAYFLRATTVTAVARLSHRNSVCPSVRHTDGSVKNGAS